MAAEKLGVTNSATNQASGGGIFSRKKAQKFSMAANGLVSAPIGAMETGREPRIFLRLFAANYPDKIGERGFLALGGFFGG